FRRWTWLTTWWRHYGGDGEAVTAAERGLRRELAVLLAFDDSASGADDPNYLLGILPCYVTRSLAQGRVLRLLGDGEVCSEHVGLMAGSDYDHRVASAFAEWLG